MGASGLAALASFALASLQSFMSLQQDPQSFLPLPSPEVSAAADNGSGLVRLTVDKDLTGLAQVQIWEAVTTGGLSLLGTWSFNYISATTIDLVGSVFVGGFTSCSLSAIIVTVV